MPAWASWTTLLAIVLGGLAGYGGHRLIGCRSGACPIWSRPSIAILYGALLGLLVALG